MTEGRLWGGRFAGGPADAMFELSRSTQFDWRLAPHDIAGSRAHAKALHAAGLLTDDEAASMDAGLAELLRRVNTGEFSPAPADEDVHGALERGLKEIVGPELGGRLRAGRSRNDQIATLIRSYLREEARVLVAEVLDVVEALAGQAKKNLGAVMPLVAEKMMSAPAQAPVAALAGTNLSLAKSEFIKMISNPQITDEIIGELYEFLMQRNNEQTTSP